MGARRSLPSVTQSRIFTEGAPNLLGKSKGLGIFVSPHPCPCYSSLLNVFLPTSHLLSPFTVSQVFVTLQNTTQMSSTL